MQLLLAVILTGCCSGLSTQHSIEQKAKPETPIDGVYVFCGQTTPQIRIAVFKEGSLTIETPNGDRLTGRYWFSEQKITNLDNLESEGPNVRVGILGIRYFDGNEQKNVRCSVSIINGNLWAGVLPVQTIENSKVFCNGEFENAEILGLSPQLVPASRVHWNESNQELTLFRSGKPLKQTVESLPIPKPSANHSSDRGSEHSSKAAPQPYQVSGRAFALAVGDQFDSQFYKRFPDAAHGRIHLQSFLRPDTGWASAKLLKDLATHQQPANEEASKQWFEKLSRFRSRTFVLQRGCVVAPWSHCLGPVGQIPTQLNADAIKKLVGECQSDHLVAMKAQEVDFTLLQFGRPSNDDVDLMMKKLEYAPNDLGLSIATPGYDCQMGHGDYSGLQVWFPVSESELVLFQTRPQCVTPDTQVRWKRIRKVAK